jgi:acetylornithine deacetylase
MLNPTLRLLRDLVAIDSVNPSLVPGAAGEAAIAAAIAAELRAIGLDVDVEEVAPGRPNVVGVLEGRQPGPTLMLCGHTDTVGVAGMTAPFDPLERNGLLFGRGAQDMKGGVAAMIGAARRLAESGGLDAGRLLVCAVIDEEHSSLGADALVCRWHADAAVVTEPTDLAVGVAHKGFAWVEVTTQGVAAHGSRPNDGEDAILKMGRVLTGLETLDRALLAGPAHPLLGTGSLHASIINGGRELSSYPDACTLQIERRTVSGESPETALIEVEDILARARRDDPRFRGTARLVFARPSYEIDGVQNLPRALTEAVRRAGRSAETVGMSFWTDAAVLGGAGIPSVIFGPGGAGLHSVEEYVRLDEVLVCCDALVHLAQAFCA